jgi:hypothetical protein
VRAVRILCLRGDEIGWWALYCTCAFAYTDLVLGGCEEEEEEEAEGSSEASLMNSGNSSMEPRRRGLRVSVSFGVDRRRVGIERRADQGF